MTHQEKVLSIIDKKYGIDDIAKPLNLEDLTDEFEVYEIDGKYYQVYDYSDVVEVTKRIRMEPVIYWDEK